MPEILLKPDGDPRFFLERWGQILDKAPTEWEGIVPATSLLIDHSVDLLRNPKAILHHDINKLMANLWRLVGNKVVPIAIASEIPFGYKGLFFMCEEKGFGLVRVLMANILVPVNWIQQVKEDRWKQMGGLVFVASQANDLYHQKLAQGQSEACLKRAQAWEAEFLHYLSHWANSGFVADDYQKQIMNAFPKGLDSLNPAWRYQLKAAHPPDFEKIDKDEEIGDALNPCPLSDR